MEVVPSAYGDKWVVLDFTGRKRVFAVKPHKDAPLFDCEAVGDEYAFIVGERLREFLESSSGGVEKANRFIEWMKQLGLVNLWFFEKYILGPFGPWDRLTDHLHLDMANYTQSEWCLGEGAFSALAIGRGLYKSTVRTSGLAPWLLVRDPNVKILVLSSIFDHASRFCRTARTVFENNDLVRLMWPSLMKGGRATVWNDTEWISPGRTKSGSEASVTAKGVGATSASQHFDYLLVDDPISVEDLDKDFGANSDMEKKKMWLRSALPPLVVSPNKSVTMYTFTFYSVEDYYMESIVPNVRRFFGDTDEEDFIYEKPDGVWAIYWRMTERDGESIFPEEVGMKFLRKMMTEDPWVFQTQYQNRPTLLEGSSFKEWPIKEAFCYHDENGKEESKIVLEGVAYPLRQCDVLMCVDWSASKKNKDEKKSKTSIEVWAILPDDKRVCIDGESGKFSVPETFDKIFKGMAKWKDYIRGVVVESNAMQLGVVQLLRKEMVDRGVFFSVLEDFVRGDKEARIKVNFGAPLAQGKIYSTVEMFRVLEREKDLFGAVKGMFDNLDSAEKAQRLLIKPDTTRDQANIRNGEMFNAEGRDWDTVDSGQDDDSFWEERARMLKGAARL